MKLQIEFEPVTNGECGRLASSGFVDVLTDEENWRKPHVVYGATVTAEKAQTFGCWLDSLQRKAERRAIETLLCGNLSTGTHTEDTQSMVTDLWCQLNGSYRTGMGTKAALPVFTALRALWGEALKEARGGTTANFAAALRNAADLIERGANLKTVRNTAAATSSIPADH